MTEKAVKAIITGRVQGVSFRAWTRAEAIARGLSGWVRNRSDGAVEALFAGPAPAVDAMLARCRDGPAAARVDTITTEEAPAPACMGVFEVRR